VRKASLQTGDQSRPVDPVSAHYAGPKLAFITIVATLGGLLFGYDTGVINGGTINHSTRIGERRSNRDSVARSAGDSREGRFAAHRCLANATAGIQ
jgi:hypothetical protein